MHENVTFPVTESVIGGFALAEVVFSFRSIRENDDGVVVEKHQKGQKKRLGPRARSNRSHGSKRELKEPNESEKERRERGRRREKNLVRVKRKGENEKGKGSQQQDQQQESPLLPFNAFEAPSKSRTHDFLPVVATGTQINLHEIVESDHAVTPKCADLISL
ncbi:hypothetical protein LR48_Vigan45s003700 [Vigna angularis]|uniref:Uncharacterized protein n=1 Tax=Phaseolus angularis TaxID=3914 RepID=A0A0L9T367_PHAAN|nr:hypothetical protein LR48_Vigan45s003700 [Vigna angularis]